MSDSGFSRGITGRKMDGSFLVEKKYAGRKKKTSVFPYGKQRMQKRMMEKAELKTESEEHVLLCGDPGYLVESAMLH